MTAHDPNERPIETPGLTGEKREFADSAEDRAAVDAGLNQVQDPDVAEAADGDAEIDQNEPRITGSDTDRSETGAGGGIDIEEARAEDSQTVAESIRDNER